MVLELVSQHNKIMRTGLEPFDFKNPPCDPVQLARDMTETMIAHGVLGLAANQVSCPWRVFVISGNPVIACFNPRIVDASTDVVALDETCASFPGMTLRVKRPRAIKVRFNTPNGEVVTTKYNGITAHVFHHELEHLDGIPFTDRVSRFHRERAFKEQKAFLRARNARKGIA